MRSSSWYRNPAYSLMCPKTVSEHDDFSTQPSSSLTAYQTVGVARRVNKTQVSSGILSPDVGKLYFWLTVLQTVSCVETGLCRVVPEANHSVS